MLTINWEDKTYELDMQEIGVREATIIKQRCGFTLVGLQEGLASGDVDALRAVYWLIKTRSGEHVNIDRLEFPVVKFANELQRAADEEFERLTAEEENELREKRAGKKVDPKSADD